MSHQTCSGLRRRSIVRGSCGAPRAVKRLVSDQGGAVLIEMSIVLLILVTMLIGVTELSQALTLQRRVVSAAATAADLMTRADRPMGINELQALGRVLDEIVGPNDVKDAENKRLFGFKVTVFTVKEVDESDKNGDATKKTKAEATGSYMCNAKELQAKDVPEEISKEVEEGGRIIMVQTRLQFQSSFTFFIKNAIALGGASFFIPRLDSDLTLTGNFGCDGKPLPPTPETTVSGTSSS
ncbi:MAG: TadE/TadG family type IV pilus assembly protein [Boseongicola sp.]